jgi:hypothetical protein
MKDFIKYIIVFPYWEFFKKETYYYFHPLKNRERLKSGKSIREMIDD